MYIELKCKNCNKRFNISFDEKELKATKCPKCGTPLTSYESERLWHLAETYYSLTKSLTNIDIMGIHEGNKNIVISSDIDGLNEVFNASSPAIRQRMTSLFDLFYLLMYHNSKDGKTKELDDIIGEVRAIWEKKIDDKAKIACDLLGIETEDNDLGQQT